MMSRLRACACTCLCVVLSACIARDYDGPRRYPLVGMVKVDGTPMDFGTISFIPAVENQRVSGGPIVDGKFSVPESRGANEGSYRVEIRWQKATGRLIRDHDTGEMIAERREGLPAKYHTASELSVEVSQDKTVFDFDLLSK